MSRTVELRDHRRELYQFQIRLAVTGVFVAAVFLMLLARLFYLQVIQHDYYQLLAEQNRVNIVPVARFRSFSGRAPFHASHARFRAWI